MDSKLLPKSKINKMRAWRTVLAVMLTALVLVASVGISPVVEWAVYRLRNSPSLRLRAQSSPHTVNNQDLSTMSLLELQALQQTLLEELDQSTPVSTMCLSANLEDEALSRPLTVEKVEAQLRYVDQLRAVSPLYRSDEWPLARDYLQDHFATFPNQIAYLESIKQQDSQHSSPKYASNSPQNFAVLMQMSRFVSGCLLGVSRYLYFFAAWAQQYASSSMSLGTASNKSKFVLKWGLFDVDRCCESKEAEQATSIGDGVLCAHRSLAPHELCSAISNGKDCLLLSVQYLVDAHAVIPMHEKAVLITFLVTFVGGALCVYIFVKTVRMRWASANLRAFVQNSPSTIPHQPATTRPQVVDTATQLTHRETATTSAGSSPRQLTNSSRSPLAMSETIAPEEMLHHSASNSELSMSGPKTAPPTARHPHQPSPSPVPPSSPTANLIPFRPPQRLAELAPPVVNREEEEDDGPPSVAPIPNTHLDARNKMYTNQRWYASLYAVLGVLVVAAIPVGALVVEGLGMSNSVAGMLLDACDSIIMAVKYAIWFVKSVMGLNVASAFVAGRDTLASYLREINPFSTSHAQPPTLLNAGLGIFLPRLFPEFDADGRPVVVLPDSTAVAPIIASLLFLNAGAMVCVKMSRYLFDMAKSELGGRYSEAVKSEVEHVKVRTETSISRSRSPSLRSPSPARAGSVPRLQLRNT